MLINNSCKNRRGEYNFYNLCLNKEDKMFKISEHLKKGRVILELSSTTKKEVIKELAEVLRGVEEVKDFDKFLEDVFQREALGTTGIGQNVALPHARSSHVKKFLICFGRSKQGIDFDSLDGEPVYLIFLIGNPKEDVQNYLKTLAHLSRMVKKEDFRLRLLNAQTEEEIIEAFKIQEELI